jgi:16S rRNA (cytidine1402-2'-O)-methyltransferase
MLENLTGERATVVAYESPHRLLDTLAEMIDVFGERRIVIARELTKLHEEFLRGSATEVHAELAKRPSVKGEITILIERSEEKASIGDPLQEIARLQDEEGMDRMEAIKAVAKRLGLPKREVYRLSAEQDNSPAGKRRG